MILHSQKHNFTNSIHLYFLLDAKTRNRDISISFSKSQNEIEISRFRFRKVKTKSRYLDFVLGAQKRNRDISISCFRHKANFRPKIFTKLPKQIHLMHTNLTNTWPRTRVQYTTSGCLYVHVASIFRRTPLVHVFFLAPPIGLFCFSWR